MELKPEVKPKLSPVISTHELIQKVYRHPMLWDRMSSSYRDKAVKEKAWLEICAELHPEYNELKGSQKRELLLRVTKKWYNVRDSYRKYLKNRNKDKKEYLHANSLSFLDGTYSNLDDDTFDDDRFGNESNDINPMSDNFENEVYLDFEEANVDPAPKRMRIEALESPKRSADDSNIIAILANLIHKEEDEDRAFFKSITPAVQKLSEVSKYEFRVEVMHLLKKISKKDKKLKKLKAEGASDSESG